MDSKYSHGKHMFFYSGHMFFNENNNTIKL